MRHVTVILYINRNLISGKPELDFRLERAVKKAVAIINEKKKIITIQSGNDDLVIAAHDILWIERIKRYSLIQCNEDTYRVSSDFEELLSHIA